MPSFLFNTSIKQCIEAWVNPEHLNQWLSESAERNGNDLILASKFPDASGRHKITKESDDELVFDWYIEGTRTILKLKFSEEGEQTKLDLEHQFETRPIGALFFKDRDYLPQLWAVAISSLREFLERGSGKSIQLPWPLNPETITLTLEIRDVTPEQVWRALTDPEQLIAGYSLTTDKLIIEPKVGGKYSYGWPSEEKGTDGPGKVLVWEENKHLAHTWHGGRDSEIHYQLKSIENNRVKLAFKHTGMRFYLGEVWSYALGWSESLYGLKWFLERGEKHSSFVDSCAE